MSRGLRTLVFPDGRGSLAFAGSLRINETGVAVVRRINLRTLCVMVFLAWTVCGGAARSAERVTSELMPVDFMQAVPTEGAVQPAFGPTSTSTEPPAMPPVEAIAPPPVDTAPMFSERVVA